MVSTDNEFSFLIVSDIHDNIGNIRKLVDWYKKENPHIDYILCCGDVVTVPNGLQDLPESAKNRFRFPVVFPALPTVYRLNAFPGFRLGKKMISRLSVFFQRPFAKPHLEDNFLSGHDIRS